MKKTNTTKLHAQQLAVFSDEMSMMLMSGVSSLEAIALMKEEAHSKEEGEFIQKIYDGILDQGTFAKALRGTESFPDYYIEMVELGEQTGQLDDVLAALARHYEREHGIYQSIRSAISYPLLMVGMLLVIILVLVTKIMPIFEKVFEQLGAKMSGVSGGLLSVGNFISTYAASFIAILFAIILVVLVMVYTEEGREKLKRWAYKTKRFRPIMNKIAVSRFASGLALTLRSGMDMLQSVEVAGKLVDIDEMNEQIEACKDELAKHMDIGRALSACGIFGGIYGRMAILAAKTGKMEQVMEKIAGNYQEEADDEIQDIISVVEPTLVIILSVVVGLILLSVMLPLLSIMTGMR